MATKKSKVKPFVIKKDKSKDELNSMLQGLREAIDSIYALEKSSHSFDTLYKNSEALVIHKRGDELYSMVEDLIKEHTLSIHLGGDTSSGYLANLYKKWLQFKRYITDVHFLMKYLDDTYVGQCQKTKIYSIGFYQFKTSLFEIPNLGTNLSESLLSQVAMHREGQNIDKAQMKSILQMLVEVGEKSHIVYQDIFENKFLEITRYLYVQESGALIGEMSSIEYLRHTAGRLKEEKTRVVDYLDHSTESKLLSIVEQCFLVDHSQTIITMQNSGLSKMMENMQTEDIRLMYTLFNRNEEILEQLSKLLGEYIVNKGQTIISDPENKKNAIKLITDILKFDQDFHHILKKCFNNNTVLQEVIQRSFVAFVNSSNKTALALAIYFDNLFQKEAKSLKYNEVHSKIDSVMVLFNYLSEKDIFEDYYRKYLAKRLISDKFVDEVEEIAIKALRSECGVQYTSKMTGMINDIKISLQDSKDYAKTRSSKLSVKILTEAYWPSEPMGIVMLSRDLQMIGDAFKAYFLDKYYAKRLTWKLSYGYVLLDAQFSRKHEFHVSVAQAGILLEFNHLESQTVAEIYDHNQIVSDELKRNIISLVKHKVIIKRPADRVLKENDVIAVNPKFSNKLIKVNLIPSSSKVSKPKEDEEVPEAVVQERKFMVDAMIVKIMKARNRINHQELIAEVIKHVSERFKPDIPLIKVRIEGLIDREYIARDTENPDFYLYKP